MILSIREKNDPQPASHPMLISDCAMRRWPYFGLAHGTIASSLETSSQPSSVQCRHSQFSVCVSESTHIWGCQAGASLRSLGFARSLRSVLLATLARFAHSLRSVLTGAKHRSNTVLTLF